MKERLMRVFTKSVIWAWLMSVATILVSFEYLIADIFKYPHYDLEYTIRIMSEHPWLTAIECTLILVGSILAANAIYKQVFEAERE